MKNRINVLVIASLTISLIGMTLQAIKWRNQCKEAQEISYASQAEAIKSQALTRKAFALVSQWEQLAQSNSEVWRPKIGDRVATEFQLVGGPVGDLRIVTITNIVHVGKERSQTGWLVYGDGLPGIDAAWVRPAP